MDAFKKKLMAKQILLAVGLLGALCAVLLTRHYVNAASFSNKTRAFAEGFQAGVIAALFGAMLLFLIRNVLTLRNQERLKKLYISETDERNLFIQRQSGLVGMGIIMYGLATGAVIAGNINDIAFFSLLCACVFVALVRGILKIYYHIKY